MTPARQSGTPSDFELRVRGEITAEEYVRRLKVRTKRLAAQSGPPHQPGRIARMLFRRAAARRKNASR